MDKLHKYTLATAIFFNSALLIGALWFFWDYDASAQSISDGTSARVTFFEDNSFKIENGTLRAGGLYIFTTPEPDEVEYTTEGIKFKNNGTVILR